MKESKTKIAYCKDYKRKLEHENVKFDFLGFSFKPTAAKSKYGQGYYTLFHGEISQSSRKKIRETLRNEKVFRDTSLSINELATRLNTRLRGWVNYYRIIGRYKLKSTLHTANMRIAKWLANKHKLGYRKSFAELQKIRKNNPKLFYHWEVGL